MGDNAVHGAIQNPFVRKVRFAASCQAEFRWVCHGARNQSIANIPYEGEWHAFDSKSCSEHPIDHSAQQFWPIKLQLK